MDTVILKNINERVKEEDTLFLLGDFCFSHSTEASDAPKKPYNYYRDQIKCHNIIFLRGNHDKNNSVKTAIQSLQIYHGGKNINLVHDPKFCNINYEINLTGHVHNNWEIQRIRRGESFTDCINVGVDVHNFYPVTYGEIISKLTKWRKNNAVV
jgi:calcineurin-like phosphoesterase family protein